MNCLCNIFDENNIWILILILAILYLSCGNGCYGNSCGGGCGGCGSSCGCGCPSL